MKGNVFNCAYINLRINTAVVEICDIEITIMNVPRNACVVALNSSKLVIRKEADGCITKDVLAVQSVHTRLPVQTYY